MAFDAAGELRLLAASGPGARKHPGATSVEKRLFLRKQKQNEAKGLSFLNKGRTEHGEDIVPEQRPE